MSDVFRKINKETVDHIKYRNTVMTGEVTAVNSDGTYNVKIAQAGSAYPNIDTLDYNANFSVGEIVDIAFEYGNRELPKIMGTAKKIAQEPSVVETDYSSGTGGGKQTEIVTISAMNTLSGYFVAYLYSSYGYSTIHNSVDGSDLVSSPYVTIFDYRENYGDLDIGQGASISGPYFDGYRATYEINRSLIFFDTYSIPTGAIITSAVLSLYCLQKRIRTTYHHSTSPYWTYGAGNNFNVVIQNGQPNYPRNPVVNSDYDCSKYGNNGGEANTSDINDEEYKDITLNSNGIAWINKGGITKFCVRSSRDIASIAPEFTLDSEDIDNCVSSQENIEFDLGYYGFLPKLTITYEI